MLVEEGITHNSSTSAGSEWISTSLSFGFVEDNLFAVVYLIITFGVIIVTIVIIFMLSTSSLSLFNLAS